MGKKRVTQQDVVLEWMRNHNGITSMDAFTLGITRLSAAIYELRRKGFDIDTVDECCKNRYGGTSVYARYKLNE